ncbi:MAG: CAP domain-containing protein [Flavobacteriaceae bacterium]
MKLLTTCLLAMVLFSTVSCSKDEGVSPVEESNYSIDLNLANETDWQMANEILQYVNEYRVSVGLSELKRDQQYASAYAVDHTQYMIDQNKISHDGFGVRAQALKDQGAESVGENVAFGYSDAQKLVQAWINSPSHRSVLEGNYTHTGFGVMQNTSGKYFFTELFYRK